MNRLFSQRGLLLVLILLCSTSVVWGQDFFDFNQMRLPDIKIEPSPNNRIPGNLQVSFFIISLSLIPCLIVSCTSYIRTTIMLSYLKSALGSTQALSNQMMMGIVMFITFYIMFPVGERINNTAIQPYLAGSIDQAQFAQNFITPVREWMLAQARDGDLAFFCKLGSIKARGYDEIPFRALMPAYIMSEIKTGFFIGFLIYLPFFVVDMVVAAVLMSMGMFMIPPTSISLPFKLVLFSSIEGWHVLILGLLKSFNKPSWYG